MTRQAPGGSYGELAFRVDEKPTAALLARLDDGLTEHQRDAVPGPGFRPLAVLAHTPDGRLCGGAAAKLNWNWLHVTTLWVEEERRRGGLGSELLARIEAEGRARGCAHAHLDTFSFQARPFYERHGYEVYGTLDDYPPGHARHYLKKDL